MLQNMEVIRREGDLEAAIPSGRNVLLAWRISRWTKEHKKDMVYRPFAEMREMFGDRRSLVMRRVYELPLGIKVRRTIGHLAITVVDGENGELGALVTQSKSKKRKATAQFGVRSLISSDIKSEVREIYAFTLGRSSGVFEGVPGVEIVDPRTSPDAFFEETIAGEGRDAYKGYRFRRPVRQQIPAMVESQTMT